MAEARPQKNSQRATLRKRKGWYGFVHGYKDWLKAVEEGGRWDLVDWGKDGIKSGAKKVEKHGNKIIYYY